MPPWASVCPTGVPQEAPERHTGTKVPGTEPEIDATKTMIINHSATVPREPAPQRRGWGSPWGPKKEEGPPFLPHPAPSLVFRDSDLSQFGTQPLVSAFPVDSGFVFFQLLSGSLWEIAGRVCWAHDTRFLLGAGVLGLGMSPMGTEGGAGGL